MGKLLGKGGMSTGNNNFNQMMQFLNGVQNPQKFLQDKLASNPQMKAMLSQMQNGYGGKSPREIAFAMAKQNGISEDQLMQLAGKFGLK